MDRSSFDRLREQHRAVEARLEALSEGIHSGKIEARAVRDLTESLERHYADEERFLVELGEGDPKLAAKLRGQHGEALEIGGRLLEASEEADAVYLARRLVAIAQHNIIEEERDVFPLFEPRQAAP